MHVDKKQFQDDDFKVTAGWGHGGKDGVTMPGKGRAEKRGYSEAELAAMQKPAREQGRNTNVEGYALPNGRASAFGDETYDIYLNNVAYWRNVPERVWNYYIGGYQVIKKWLSYREFALLGRPLTLDEITEVTDMTRRIAALILLESELNNNYQKIRSNTYAPAE